MSFHSWLHNHRSALTPARVHRVPARRGARRVAPSRLSLEPLEDRRLLAFAAPIDYDTGAYNLTIVSADFNNDDYLDLATANYYDGTVSVLLGDSQGGFGPAKLFPVGFNPRSVAVGDFNEDGKIDIAYSSTNCVSVLHGHGDGTFSSPVHSPAGRYPAATAAGDFDDDGQLSWTITVAVQGDRLGESTETFAVNLSAPTNATIGDGQGLGTVVDNEPRISISDVTRKEGKNRKTTLFSFTITLSAAYDQPVKVSYGTVDGTATTGDSDYIAKTVTLTFAPGETAKTITIEVKGDRKREANETFYLDLFGNSSNSWFTRNRGIGTILNDD
jgi:hypothetical protein